MKEELEKLLTNLAKGVFGIEINIVLTRPDEQFGDYATNVALQLARKLSKNPTEIATELAEKIKSQLPDKVADASVAGPGFVNLKLNDNYLLQNLKQDAIKPFADQIVVLEYSDPNPFKVLHAGHLYQGVIGDAIANLLKNAGANLHCVNFGGDVGLHVAKNMWAIIKYLGGEQPDKLTEIPENERSNWLSKCYVEGNNAYDDSEEAKAEIIAINKRIYQIHADNDHDSPFAKIYWACRQWSYDYFDAFYERLGSKFEKYYPESETAPLGIKTVREQLAKGVYEESDGAVIFRGEKYGLHTRVFINSNGLPTYETKEVGLSMAKWRDYHFDRTIIITGNDIVEYMKVVLKSMEQFEPELVKRTTHLTHGNVKLVGGLKMSSRKGNIVRAMDVLDAAAKANKKLTDQDNEQVVLGAVKYAFLKNRIGGDIIYDPDESVSLEGNSGPYLQYAHARARSILAKVTTHEEKIIDNLEADERSLVRKISEYPEAVNESVAELMPHHICTYLYELAQTFNRFYEHNRVIDNPRQSERLKLVSHYAYTLKNGLELLGIPAPEHL